MCSQQFVHTAGYTITGAQNNDFQMPSLMTAHYLISVSFIDFVLTSNDTYHHFLLAGQKGRMCTHLLCGHFTEVY